MRSDITITVIVRGARAACALCGQGRPFANQK